MKIEHDIWLTVIQGHERAPLNDQELKQTIGLVNAAIKSLEALNSDHYRFLVHDLAHLGGKLYLYPNAERAMNPNVPSVGDWFVIQEAPGVPTKWRGKKAEFLGLTENGMFKVGFSVNNSGDNILLEIEGKSLKAVEEREIPSCLCCGQSKYNCVGCGWELGSG